MSTGLWWIPSPAKGISCPSTRFRKKNQNFRFHNRPNNVLLPRQSHTLRPCFITGSLFCPENQKYVLTSFTLSRTIALVQNSHVYAPWWVMQHTHLWVLRLALAVTCCFMRFSPTNTLPDVYVLLNAHLRVCRKRALMRESAHFELCHDHYIKDHISIQKSSRK